MSNTKALAAAAVGAAGAAVLYTLLRPAKGGGGAGGALATPDAAKEESAEERDARLTKKFAPKEGLTFYFFPRSPCARRVWLTLMEKKIPHRAVVVNLRAGEQRHARYLAINPQGKVPAIRVQGMAASHGIEDCILYESAAITEWLDEQFPNSIQLYPADPTLRSEVKMWQYWELALAEEVWPLSRHQVDGALWRWEYTPEKFMAAAESWSDGDPFYVSKVSKIYKSLYLTDQQVRRSVKRIVRGFTMLENALTDGRQYLVGASFSQADIASYPRLVKAPQNGILATSAQRRLFPKTLEFFERIKARDAFEKFRYVDWRIWQSGTFPRFLGGLTGWCVPWSLLIAVGNWNARSVLKDTGPYVRVTMSDPTIMTDARAMAAGRSSAAGGSERAGEVAIPRQPGIARALKALSLPPMGAGGGARLFYSNDLPMSVGVQIVLDELGGTSADARGALPGGVAVTPVGALLCKNVASGYLELNPWGEVPSSGKNIAS